MVTMQEAFERAKEYAREVLGDMDYTLEEVERDSYKDRQVWRITLGFPKRRPTAPELMRALGAGLPLALVAIGHPARPQGESLGIAKVEQGDHNQDD